MQGLDSAPEEHSFLEILNQTEQLTILRMFNHVFQSQDLYVILPPLLLQLSGTIVDRAACMNGAVGGIQGFSCQVISDDAEEVIDHFQAEQAPSIQPGGG